MLVYIYKCNQYLLISFSADEIAMSRCKSPVGSSGSTRIVRHERGGSADTGLIRPDNLSSYASSDEPNPSGNTEDDGVCKTFTADVLNHFYILKYVSTIGFILYIWLIQWC